MLSPYCCSECLVDYLLLKLLGHFAHIHICDHNCMVTSFSSDLLPSVAFLADPSWNILTVSSSVILVCTPRNAKNAMWCNKLGEWMHACMSPSGQFSTSNPPPHNQLLYYSWTAQPMVPTRDNQEHAGCFQNKDTREREQLSLIMSLEAALYIKKQAWNSMYGEMLAVRCKMAVLWCTVR